MLDSVTACSFSICAKPSNWVNVLLHGHSIKCGATCKKLRLLFHALIFFRKCSWSDASLFAVRCFAAHSLYAYNVRNFAFDEINYDQKLLRKFKVKINETIINYINNLWSPASKCDVSKPNNLFYFYLHHLSGFGVASAGTTYLRVFCSKILMFRF